VGISFKTNPTKHQNERPKLPLRIINRATILFAKDTGMSGSQITDFFAEYGDQIEDYWNLPKPIPSRRVIFKDCLRSFSYNEQIKILKELCEIDESFCRVKYPFFRQMDSLIVVVMDLLGYSFNQLP